MNLFVLAGTEDGRKLALALQKQGHQVLLSTLTEYGAEIAELQGLKVRSGALDEDSLRGIIRVQEVHGLIDATHPYAQNIQGLARSIAAEVGVPYFRWERPPGEYPTHTLIHFVPDLERAGQLAARLGKRIFLSTGSKNLRDWLNQLELQNCEIFARVLPTAQVLTQCEEVGLKPNQIIAIQGPFTQKFNEALWEQLKIDVVITKESGSIGGTLEKVQACLELKIPVIILARPQMDGARANITESYQDIASAIEDFIRKVEEAFGC